MDKILLRKNDNTIIDHWPELRAVHMLRQKQKEEEDIETSNNIMNVTVRLPKLTFTHQEDICLKVLG